MASASGRSRCRTFALLPLIVLLPVPMARGQETPPVGPSTPGQEAAPRPPVSPVPGPPAPEILVPGGPIRTLRFAPLPEEIGPLRVQTFLSLEEEFTDNVNQRKDNRKSEFRTSVAPGVTAHIEGARTNLSLAYAPRYLLPGNRPQDATLDHNLTLRSGWKPSPFVRFSLAEDFTKSTDFRDVEDPGTRRTGTQPFVRNQGTVEAAYIPPQGRAALSYTNVSVRNDAPGADNSLTHILRSDVELANPRLTLGGSYTLTRGEFDIASPYWENSIEGRARRGLTPTVDATLTTLFTHHDEDRGQDFTLGRVRLGGIWTLGTDGSLDAGAGAEVFAPRDGSTSIRPSATLAWAQRFALLSLSVRFEESLVERFQQVDNTGVARSRSASVLLTTLAYRDLTATLGARWTENRFEQTTVAGGPAGTRDRTWDLEAGIRYVVFRWLNFALTYTATIRTSTTPTAEFLENRLRFRLTYQHDIF